MLLPEIIHRSLKRWIKRNHTETGLEIATPDRWWLLARDNAIFRRHPFQGVLKDFGYLTLLEHLQKHEPSKVLEFGHGVWTQLEHSLLQPQLTEKFELWGIDDFAQLAYFPSHDDWKVQYDQYVQVRPGIKFVRGFLGEPSTSGATLPEAYFDLICSVSVLEELPLETSRKILAHCLQLLRPGGQLVVSWDFPFNQALRRITQSIQVIRSCGFELSFSPLELFLFPRWPLREIQLEVMAWYQQGDGRDRKYRTDWGTAVYRARRPL